MITTVEDSLVSIPKETIVAKLEAYRQHNKQALSHTDNLYKRALRNLNKFSGSRLVDMSQVMMRGGLDDNYRPKLAIARADWDEVSVQKSYSRDDYSLLFRERDSRSYAKESSVYVPPLQTHRWYNIKAAVAVVPHIPIEKRPIDDLSNYWVLFEADWKDIPIDPYLLKRIDDSLLFVVIDQWNLTDLERMVMRAAR